MFGIGVAQDRSEGLLWLEASASQGNAKAMALKKLLKNTKDAKLAEYLASQVAEDVDCRKIVWVVSADNKQEPIPSVLPERYCENK